MGHVFGDAMTSLAHTWRMLLTPALTLSVLASLATVAVFRLTGGYALLDVVVNNPGGLTRVPDEVVSAMTRPYYQAMVVTIALHIATGVLIALVSQRIALGHLTGSVLDARAVWGQAFRRYVVGLSATLLILAVVAVLLGVGLSVWLTPVRSVGTPNTPSLLVATLLFVVLIAPGVWVAVAGSMATATVAAEGMGLVATLRRSFELVRGRWVATAGFLFLVGFLGSVSIALIQLVALPLASVGGDIDSLTVMSILGVLTQGLLVAAIAVMCTHWYLDLRARKEGLASSDLG